MEKTRHWGRQKTQTVTEVWGASNPVTVPRCHLGKIQWKPWICGLDFFPVVSGCSDLPSKPWLVIVTNALGLWTNSTLHSQEDPWLL